MDFALPSSSLRTLPAVTLLAELAGATPCHLVGGAIRDAALGRQVHDLDAVVEGRGEEIARALAQRLPARFVPLGGKEFPAFRLVAADLELDLWDRSGMTLSEDLARRDLTINAVALDLRTGETADPFEGLVDLERRLLRAVTPRSFSGDPLRILRLARFAVQLPGFKPSSDTLALARASALDLPTVAGERIRDELERIASAERAAVGVEILGEIGIYPGLWAYRLGEVVPFSAVVRRLEAYEDIGRREGWPAGPAWTAGRWALLFAGLREMAGGSANPARGALARFADRGYLARAEVQAVRTLLALPQVPETAADRRLFLHGLGDELWRAGVGYLSASGALADGDFHTLATLALTRREEIFDPPRLLSSDRIREVAGIAPGPELGRLLDAVRSAQVRGEVNSAAAAEALVRSQMASR